MGSEPLNHGSVCVCVCVCVCVYVFMCIQRASGSTGLRGHPVISQGMSILEVVGWMGEEQGFICCDTLNTRFHSPN